MIDAQTLGRRIKYFRKRAGLSQMDLELEINGSAGMISRIEKGKVNPSKETVRRIAEILEMNNRELDYLIGVIAEPANNEEIRLAIEAIKEHFDRNDVFGYLIDERWRLLYISKNTQRLFDMLKKGDTTISNDFHNVPLLEVVLSQKYGFNKLFSDKELDMFLKYQFTRFVNEVGFMKDDENFQRVLKIIDLSPRYQKIWNEVQGKNVSSNIYESRTVAIKISGLKIKLNYSREILSNNPRFETIEVFPNNKFLKLLIKGIK